MRSNFVAEMCFVLRKVRSFRAAKRPMTAKKMYSTNTYKFFLFQFNKENSQFKKLGILDGQEKVESGGE